MISYSERVSPVRQQLRFDTDRVDLTLLRLCPMPSNTWAFSRNSHSTTKSAVPICGRRLLLYKEDCESSCLRNFDEGISDMVCEHATNYVCQSSFFMTSGVEVQKAGINQSFIISMPGSTSHLQRPEIASYDQFNNQSFRAELLIPPGRLEDKKVVIVTCWKEKGTCDTHERNMPREKCECFPGCNTEQPPICYLSARRPLCAMFRGLKARLGREHEI